MIQFQSNDPRAVRTREAIQLAFKELLREKSFQKITVTEIAARAGFARHTFYNHYETKEDILNHLVDDMFDNFFSDMDKWDFRYTGRGEDVQMVKSFFQIMELHGPMPTLVCKFRLRPKFRHCTWILDIINNERVYKKFVILK